MNKKSFQWIMEAADDDILEEAMEPGKKSSHPAGYAAVAACLLSVIGLFSLIRMFDTDGYADREPILQKESNTQELQITDISEESVPQEKTEQKEPEKDENVFSDTNQHTEWKPVQMPAEEIKGEESLDPASLSKLVALGFNMQIPDGAEDVSYFLMDPETARATYSLDNIDYTCMIVKNSIMSNTEDTLCWRIQGVRFAMEQNDEGVSVAWCSDDDETVCRLQSDADVETVLTTAWEVLKKTGLNVSVTQEYAEDVCYNVFEQDGLTVAEVRFLADGLRWTYRMAHTSVIEEEFADLSGQNAAFSCMMEASVRWCPAKLCYNQGGQGKLIWFDVVPGLLYSLSVEEGASETALQTMAETLFVPAQGEVG